MKHVNIYGAINKYPWVTNIKLFFSGENETNLFLLLLSFSSGIAIGFYDECILESCTLWS